MMSLMFQIVLKVYTGRFPVRRVFDVVHESKHRRRLCDLDWFECMLHDSMWVSVAVGADSLVGFVACICLLSSFRFVFSFALPYTQRLVHSANASVGFGGAADAGILGASCLLWARLWVGAHSFRARDRQASMHVQGFGWISI